MIQHDYTIEIFHRDNGVVEITVVASVGSTLLRLAGIAVNIIPGETVQRGHQVSTQAL